jgi:hypothetical protein
MVEIGKARCGSEISFLRIFASRYGRSLNVIFGRCLVLEIFLREYCRTGGKSLFLVSDVLGVNI